MAERSNQELFIFYDTCFEKISKNVYPLKNRKEMICAIQTVRYVLKDILKDQGSAEVLNILKAGECGGIYKDLKDLIDA